MSMTTRTRRRKQNVFIDRDEGWEILEEMAQRELSMSAREFIRAWQAGEIEDPDRPEVMRVWMLLPLAR